MRLLSSHAATSATRPVSPVRPGTVWRAAFTGDIARIITVDGVSVWYEGDDFGGRETIAVFTKRWAEVPCDEHGHAIVVNHRTSFTREATVASWALMLLASIASLVHPYFACFTALIAASLLALPWCVPGDRRPLVSASAAARMHIMPLLLGAVWAAAIISYST